MNHLTDKNPIPEVKKSLCIILTVLVMIIPSLLTAQQSEPDGRKQFLAAKNDLQDAIVSHDKKKLIKAKYAMKDFINNENDEVKKLAYYYMAYADYRLFILFPKISKKQKRQYLDEAISDLKKATTMDASFADGEALLGSVYGMKMGVGAPGQIYGPKSGAAMQEALKNGPDNPRVHLLHGIGLLYSPVQYGGGVKRAIRQFEKSADLFETQTSKSELRPAWGHAEVYAWLGQAYEKNGDLTKAKKAYQHALDVNPYYGWVKYSLLPALKKKMKS